MVRRYCLVALFLAASAVPACTTKPSAGGKCTVGALACTDAKTGLFCAKEGTWEPMTCGGTLGCQNTDGKVACDQSVASVCDVCPGSAVACDTGMKNVLTCTDGKFVPTETCKSPGSCKLGKSANVAACDTESAASVTPASVAVPAAPPAGGGKTTSTAATPTPAAAAAAPSDPTGISCPQGTKWGFNASSAFGDGRKNDGWACITCDHGEKCAGCKGAACVGGSSAGAKKPAAAPAGGGGSHACGPNLVWSTQWNACVAK